MGCGVVGMAVGRHGCQQYLRPQFSKDAYDRITLGAAIFDAAVGQARLPSVGQTEMPSRLSGFRSALVDRAAGRKFTSGQIEDGGAQTSGGEYQERSAHSEVRVVRMGTDGQYIHGHSSISCTPKSVTSRS
jgi:hypothetical protein